MKYLFLLLASADLLACPYCAGTPTSNASKVFIILAIFILLTYIPMTILFRLFKKYQ